jgi:glycosyltransferase involved in cell wall biosynthesis
VNSIRVLLPVHNAQQSLEAGAIEILDLLAEISGCFELCILDDGSTDDTAETARDLAARYPQVRLLRHPLRLGLAEAIQTGLDHAPGEIILVGDEDYCLEPDDLRTLWQLRDDQWRLLAGETPRAPWIDRLLAWRSQAASRRGMQIIFRQAFEQFRLRQAVALMHRIDGGRRAVAAPSAARAGYSHLARFALDD